MRTRRRAGFTLVEILIVLTIILLVTTIAAPAIYTALNGRQVTDGARIFTGALAGARDAAIKYNEPRGIRLLPDPLRTIPAPGELSSGTIQLVYNRMIPIEPAGDYSEGKINIGPHFPSGGSPGGFPPAYPRPDPFVANPVYPYFDSTLGNVSHVLMVEESVQSGGYTTTGISFPNAPTNWYWNIRVGDKIKINGTGRAYTVVGPCTINPLVDPTNPNFGNMEMYVNVGPPGTKSPLARKLWTADTSTSPPTFAPRPGLVNPEFLFLVNGEDDDGDGYVDEGFNGYDEPIPTGTPNPPEAPNGFTDEVAEWEPETWATAVGSQLTDPDNTNFSPSSAWLTAFSQNGFQDLGYTIQRRPVPSQDAREIALPAGVVIDATTWNIPGKQERSRLPVLPGSLYSDIMLQPNGAYIPTTVYSSTASGSGVPFIHFWMTDDTDVYPRGSVWGVDANGVPNVLPQGRPYELPMTEEVLGPDANSPGGLSPQKGLYPPTDANVPPNLVKPTPVLKGERRLVTLFTKNGVVVTNTIETVAPTSAAVPGEGFNINSVDYPFLKAQLGQREAR